MLCRRDHHPACAGKKEHAPASEATRPPAPPGMFDSLIFNGDQLGIFPKLRILALESGAGFAGWLARGRDRRPRQEFNVVVKQRLRIEAQIFRIVPNHLKGFHARRHARHVAVFDGLHMIGMNAGGFAGILEGFATLFALALQEPAGFAGGIACAIGLFAEDLRLRYSVSSRPNSSCGSSMVLLSRATKH